MNFPTYYPGVFVVLKDIMYDSNRKSRNQTYKQYRDQVYEIILVHGDTMTLMNTVDEDDIIENAGFTEVDLVK